jgi:hypothetical protein
MTSRANYAQGQTFDNEEAVDEEVELSAAGQVLAMANLAGWHLRRAIVFIPLFGVVFLAIGFMWFQGVREEASLKLRSDQLSILLDQPAPEPDVLLQQADGWETAYQVVLDGRISRPEDSDLVERVINAAADAGLVIVETGTTADSVATIENEVYTATPLLISAIGTIEGIEAYLAILETSEFAAFGIEASTVEEGLVGYQLTLRGLYYSLPEDFGEEPTVEDGAVAAVTPIVPVGEGGAK